AVGQGAGGRLADRLQVEEIDNLFHLAAMFQFLAPRTSQPVQRARDEIVFQEGMPPDHDVVEHAHVVEQGEILEGATDSKGGAASGIEVGDVVPTIDQRALARPVAPGDAVDHAGLAGAVRPMMENSSPSLTPKLTSVSARTPPNRKDTPRASRM